MMAGRRIPLLLLAYVAWFLTVGAASPEFISGRVVAITDGDTARVRLRAQFSQTRMSAFTSRNGRYREKLPSASMAGTGDS
jgi:hypothetical protein